jgi:dihydrofolate reductase
MILSLVVAMSKNRVIGRDGDLPWRLPNDLKHFKQVTMGKPIIMGRKTWESLYVKPLPGRRNIVITRNAGYEAEGAEISDSLESALILATGEDEAMIIGGAELFATALDTATRLHLTEIHADIEGDTYFPNSDRSLWREISREPHDAEGDAPAYSFLLLEKR